MKTIRAKLIGLDYLINLLLMNRERRRRINDSARSKELHEETNNLTIKEKDSKVLFMEHMDYKMEIENKTEPKKMVVLKS